MNNSNNISSGVQELIDNIRDKGVKAGQEEANELINIAKAKAKKIISDAEQQAASCLKQSKKQIDAEETAAIAALRVAARDATLELKSSVFAAFAQYVKRLVSKATRDEDFVRSLVLVLAGHAADGFVADKQVYIALSESLFEEGNNDSEEHVQDRVKGLILAISAEMLRDGIQLIPANDIHGGARVKLDQEDLELDLSDKAISSLMLKYMLPRFKNIIEGVEQ